MKLLKTVLFGILMTFVVLAVIGFLLPANVHVERRITINAESTTLFAILNDLKNFNHFSPWAERDPETLYTFVGPATGVGSKMSWDSAHPQIGSGSRQIIATEPDRLVKGSLDYGNEGKASYYFQLKAKGPATEVTWGFDSDFGYDIMGRYMGLFLLETWIGTDYEKGLNSLKKWVEKS